MPRVIKVIECMESVGEGTEKSPFRLVKRYYTVKGKFLAESDPYVPKLEPAEAAAAEAAILEGT